jgi:hypothetical protein
MTVCKVRLVGGFFGCELRGCGENSMARGFLAVLN